MGDIIKRLPTGAKFKATSGSGSLQSKFRHAASAGGLNQLKASQEAIIKLAKKRQTAIQKGKYSKSQVDSDLRSISGMSNQGKRELRQMLTHLSKGNAPKAASKTAAKNAKPSRTEAKKAQLHKDPRRSTGGALDFLDNSRTGGATYDPSVAGGGVKGRDSSTSGTTAAAAASGGYHPPALKI